MHKILLACATLCTTFLPTLAAATKEHTENQHKRAGETRVHGKAWVWEHDDGTLEAQVEVTVKKAGLAGTGWGSVHLLLLDKDGGIVAKLDVAKSVGAKAPQGLNEGTDGPKKIKYRQAQAEKIVGWLVYTEIEDKNWEKMGEEALKDKVLKPVLDKFGGMLKAEVGKKLEAVGATLFRRK